MKKKKKTPIEEKIVNYRIRPKKKKLFIMEARWTHLGILQKKSKWFTWKRYKTLQDRDKAYEVLSRQKKSWIQYRKGNDGTLQNTQT